MRKYSLLLVLPLVLAVQQQPAAVFEDVFELGRPSVTFLATAESRNGMRAYLHTKNRPLRDSMQRPSAIAAYTAAHERYQTSEEKRYDRVRLENMRKIASVRTKRLDPQTSRKPKRLDIVPREIFKFELSDAMVFQPNEQSTDAAKVRTKREDKPLKRLEPQPREIIMFELADAITSKPTQENHTASPHRRKRSATPDPREVIQFELQDAKTPEGYHKRVTENLRMPFTTVDHYKRGMVFDEKFERPESSSSKKSSGQKGKRESPHLETVEAEDMNLEESRRVKVTRSKKQKQLANYDDLPPNVQKAIDIAIQENDRMNGKQVTEVYPTTQKYYFGDKKPKQKKSYSSTTKISEPKFVASPKIPENKFIPNEQVESDFKPMTPVPASSVESIKPEQGIPKTWWSYSDHRRPKRLHHKSPYVPLVVSPQYVNTFKPTDGYKINELSSGYQRPEHYGYKQTIQNTPDEVIIQEKPKIQYVIKEVPVPVQVKQPRTKITVQPSISISYDKETTGPSSSEATNREQQQHYSNPYGPLELQYEPQHEPAKSYQKMKIVIPEPKDESQEQQQPQYYDHSYNHVEHSVTPSPSSTHSKEGYDTTGTSIAALSALIGQRPNVQLKGLNDLLHMPIPIGNQRNPKRPQDSTAPIMFPESSTPSTPKLSKPGYRSVKIENGPKIVYDDSLYHTVHMNPQLQVPMSKEYTPINEIVSDISDSDLVGPTIATPTHATYIIGTPKPPVKAAIVDHRGGYESEASHEAAYQHISVHSTPSPPVLESIPAHHHLYQEQHHHHHHHHHDDENADHYDDSEGYAFGYRVRDFHTGNDFGHVQNHDNGVTRGEYHILLPDGRVQNVRYMADEKGFHADVTYESVHQPSSSHR